MKTELLINCSAHETRIAIIENGVLQEVHIERPQNKGIVGNIYKGKVVRVLPGMQAAFVDIGLERAGFLHVADIIPYAVDGEEELDLSGPEADIRKWLQEGQDILVQVVKDPLGTKGARLTTHLSIASRFLVYMPDLDHIGVSLRLEDPLERDRLQKVMEEVLTQQAAPRGYIVRTVAEGRTHQDLHAEVTFLNRLWAGIMGNSDKAIAPAVVHEDLPLARRAIRDMVNENVETIRVDHEPIYQTLIKFAQEFVPGVHERIQYYASDRPIFDMYGVEDELQKALERKVPLKSGGYIVIDQTEAMTTIDVNTGGFVGTINLEETIFRTNLEAAQTIGRQLRLRNLGGIIIIDFIDMSEEEHKAQLITTFEKVLAQDYAKTMISDISPLGLVQMTRKRTQESLSQQLCEPCQHCGGRGYVKTMETITHEIFRGLVRDASFYEGANGLLLLASPTVINWLQEEGSEKLAELELQIQMPVKLNAEPHYLREQFDIIMM